MKSLKMVRYSATQKVIHRIIVQGRIQMDNLDYN